MIHAVMKADTSASSNSANGSSANSAGSIDTTFLQLLTTELRSQDPTSPMDSTQMVGQMVSLNQLDQLIAIHQLLQPSSAAASGTPAPANNGGH